MAICEYVSPEELQQITERETEALYRGAAARERGLEVHCHFLETEWELNYIREELKTTPERYLEETGLLSTPGTVLAHAV